MLKKEKMIERKKILALALVLVFTLGACAGAAQSPQIIEENMAVDSGAAVEMTQEVMMESASGDETKASDTSDDMVEEDTQADAAAGSSEEMPVHETPQANTGESAAIAQGPAYFSAVLTDPSSGQAFTIKDHAGKVVLVETMAMWCSNCMKQQQQVKALHGLLGEREDFISLGLDIDPNENLADLKGYVERNGFDWLYAVAPVEVAREIDQLYGSQFLNPTSTPMFIIDRQGMVHTLPFGIKSADELNAALQPFLN